MIPLARRTLVREWRRFVPAVLAIGFSGLLLLVQAALVLGIFGSAAVSVTASSADLWAGYPGTQSVNFGRTVHADVEMALRMDADVADVEPYLWVEGDWHGPRATASSAAEAVAAGAAADAGGVSVFVSGLRTDGNAMMFDRLLLPTLRQHLQPPGAVIVDRADLESLGVAVGDRAWINGKAVQVVAAIGGLRALGGVNVLASLDTARRIDASERGTADASPANGANTASVASVGHGGATYFVARLRNPHAAAAVQARLHLAAAFGPVQVWTADDFAQRSQLYWLLNTGAGAAVLFMAVIVCLVGAVITSQSLTAVVAASAREYAVLNALGASVLALSRVVLEQAAWVGLAGLLVGGLASALTLAVAAQHDVPVALNLPVALGCAALVGALALLSGLLAVRGLLRADTALLLR